MIPGLDGLRAIAYLLVFFFHANYLGVGWIGVQFFFVLSGFLITGILLDMKKSLPMGAYFTKFYGRRFLRIFPLYYFYLICMGILTAWLLSIKYRVGWLESFDQQVKYAIFYVYNFFFTTVHHTSAFSLEHLWSLSVEEQFYIFWPLVIFLIPERFQKKLFLAFIALGPIFRILFYFVHTSGEFRIFRPVLSEALYPLPFTHIDAFAFGAYISKYSLPKVKTQFYVLLVLVPLIGFASQYFATGTPGEILALGYPFTLSDGYKFIWGYSLLNYFFAVTIQAVSSHGLFNRFLEWSPMRYMGKISYGLYVFHQPIIWFALDIQELGLEKNTARVIATIIAFFGTLLVASLSYRFMEKPILSLKDRFFPVGPPKNEGGQMQVMAQKVLPTPENTAITILMLAGFVLRIRQYLIGRSLWVDEAMLALNIINRNFISLFKPLDYDQGAPIGFLLIEKLFNSIFGRNEYALRLFPLILGLLSLWMFYLLLKRYTRGWGLVIAFALFALNPILIYYSSEVKQYIGDVFVTVSLLLLFVNFFDSPHLKQLGILTLTGFLALWLSHPAVFILAGIGTTLLISYLKKRDFKNAGLTAVMGVFWLANMGLLYKLTLGDLQHNSYMREYWQGAFAPMPPWSNWGWYWGIFQANANSHYAVTFAPWILFLLMLAGWVILFQKNRALANTIAWTLFFAMLASSLSLYPSAERMTLFLVPVGIFLAGTSLDAMLSKFQGKWIVQFILAAGTSVYLFHAVLPRAMEQFTAPKYFEHIRPTMEYLQENWKNGDAMYISNGGVPAFEYYAPMYELENIPYIAGSRDDYENKNQILKKLDPLQGKQRVWILFSHVYETGNFNEKDFILDYLNEHGEKEREFRKAGTSVFLYLYDLSQ